MSDFVVVVVVIVVKYVILSLFDYREGRKALSLLLVWDDTGYDVCKMLTRSMRMGRHVYMSAYIYIYTSFFNRKNSRHGPEKTTEKRSSI